MTRVSTTTILLMSLLAPRTATVLALATVVLTGLADNVAAEAKPLKVYILAGQSNMQGHAKTETFDYIGDDPATAPMLKEMRGPDGAPKVCEKVWISYYTADRREGMDHGEGFGKLTAGYGARDIPDVNHGRIGPEFTFGIYMSRAYDGPILIIKTAWGGKSLNTDFRPPSAGPYVLPQKTKELWAKHPQGAHGIPKAEDRPDWQAEKDKATGRYYRLMIEHVKKVLADPKRVCPTYDPNQGYELAGFVWFQGWNDMCDGHTYPNRHQPGGYAEYSRLMACFIRDVRNELAAPRMPFVIGVIGGHGDGGACGDARVQGNRRRRADGSVLGRRPAGHRRQNEPGQPNAILPADTTQGPRQQRRQDDAGGATELYQRF